MQLICEAYAILKDILGMDADATRRHFRRVEQRRARELSHRDHIADFSQKSIPKPASRWWMSSSTKRAKKGPASGRLQAAIKQYVVISTINAAVEARVISSRKEERVAASKILPQPRARTFKGNRDRFVDAVRDALYASKIISYAQGMELLRSGSTTYELELEPERHRHDLAGRLYHSRQISQSNR